MYKLAPSILAADFAALGSAVAAIERAGVHYIHFDVMDGRFVPNISFGIPVLNSLKKVTKLQFDVHLMIAEPAKFIEAFAKAGAAIISIHWEAMENGLQDFEACYNIIKDNGKMAGIVLNPHTPLENILPVIPLVDMVLIMSVEPGFGGQSFLPFSLGKAERLANFIQQEGLNTDIQMDGGIDLTNLRTVLSSGVNVVVAGTSIFGAQDIGMAVQRYLETFASFEARKKNKQKKTLL